MVKTPKPSCSHKIRSTKRPLVGQPSVKHERRKVQTNQPIFPGTSLSHLFTNPSKHDQATSLALNSFQDAAHQYQQDFFHPYQGLSPKYPACYLAARAGMLWEVLRRSFSSSELFGSDFFPDVHPQCCPHPPPWPAPPSCSNLPSWHQVARLCLLPIGPLCILAVNFLKLGCCLVSIIY